MIDACIDNVAALEITHIILFSWHSYFKDCSIFSVSRFDL